MNESSNKTEKTVIKIKMKIVRLLLAGFFCSLINGLSGDSDNDISNSETIDDDSSECKNFTSSISCLESYYSNIFSDKQYTFSELYNYCLTINDSLSCLETVLDTTSCMDPEEIKHVDYFIKGLQAMLTIGCEEKTQRILVIARNGHCLSNLAKKYPCIIDLIESATPVNLTHFITSFQFDELRCKNIRQEQHCVVDKSSECSTDVSSIFNELMEVFIQKTPCSAIEADHYPQKPHSSTNLSNNISPISTPSLTREVILLAAIIVLLSY